MAIFDRAMAFNVKFIRKYLELCYYKNSFGKDRKETIALAKQLPKEGKGKSLFIILNGPSLKRQDLLKLKGEELMFVNRGFLHPNYKELQPKYHVFSDPKMVSGVWPLEWLDQIFEMCPNIRIILPVEWHAYKKFERFKNDKRIFWQYWVIPFYVNGVSSKCFSYGISQEFDNIFFTGFDANGCAYDMIRSSENSHFYGADPELSNMNSKQHSHALFTTYLQLEDLRDFSRYCLERNINIYNLTDGGLLDMFIRRDFNDPYNKQKEIPIGKGVL